MGKKKKLTLQANNPIQASNSVMCGYFCIGLIEFMLSGQKITDFTSMFSLYGFEKKDNIIQS